MSRLYDHKSKTWVDVQDADVDDLVRAGTHTFETGIKIPVVAPDGELMEIRADDAHSAFQEGFRWQTQADRDVYFAEESDRIRQEHFGNSEGTAFLAGAARGATLGLSDVALDAAGLGEATKAVKDLNPISSGAGSVAGVLGTLPLGSAGVAGVGSKLFKAGEGVGAAGAARVAGTVAQVSPRAAQAIKAATPVLTGSAVEGAFYGLGEGVSEAALGNPDDVASNLVAGVGLGALTGGVLGGAFGAGKAAKPYLAKMIESTTSGLDNIVQRATRKLASTRLRASLNAQGRADLAEKVGDLVNTPEGALARQLYEAGEGKLADELVSATKETRRLLEKENVNLRKSLTTITKEATEQEQILLKDALDKEAGNVSRAFGRLQDDARTYYAVARETRAAALDPDNTLQSLLPAVDRTMKALRKSGAAGAKERANELKAQLQHALSKPATQGQAVDRIETLRRTVAEHIFPKGSNKTIADILKPLYQKADDLYKGYPNEALAADNVFLDSYYTLTKKLERPLATKSKILKTVRDPDTFDAVRPLLERASKFAPEFEALKAAADNKIAREAALKQLRAKISEQKQSSVDGRLTLQQLGEIVDELGLLKGSTARRLERATAIEKSLQGIENLTPMEAAIRIERAAGKGPSKLEKYLPHEKSFSALDEIRAVDAAETLGSAATRGVVGYAVGSVAGPGAGAVVGGLLRPARPATVLRVLTRIERESQRGAQKLASAMKGTVDALLSNTIRKAALAGAAQSYKPDRDTYERYADKLGTLAANPEAMVQQLTDAAGGASAYTPEIYNALAQKTMAAVAYLTEQLPKDPLAGLQPFPTKSYWRPSDQEVSDFLKVAAVVNDPTVAVEALGAGTITPKQVDALRTVHPEVFSQLQTAVISGMMEGGAEVGYRSRLLLSQVFGFPTDYTLTPAFVKAAQDRYAPGPDKGGRPDVGGTYEKKRSIEIKPRETFATEVDQITYKGLA